MKKIFLSLFCILILLASCKTGNSDIQTYTVTFHLNGGKVSEGSIAEQTIEEGKCAKEPSVKPEKENYTFKYWGLTTTASESFDFSTPVTKDLKLYANYSKNQEEDSEDSDIQTYTVTFHLNGGKVSEGSIAEQTIEEGKCATEPSVKPEKENYSFKYWGLTSPASEAFDFSTPVTKDLNLYANYSKNQEEDSGDSDIQTYTVTFHLNGGNVSEGSIAEQTIEEGKCATEPSVKPEKENYSFEYWGLSTTASEAFDFSTPVTKDLNLYANYRKNQEEDSENTSTITTNSSDNTPESVTPDSSTQQTDDGTWLTATSLKTTFVDGGFFDRFGLACEQNELENSNTAKGLLHHANTTTPGNELKPQFVFWYQSRDSKTNFTASNGKTIAVPSFINFSAKMDPYLEAAKTAGIQIRGHVLTWHSQTPEWFFTSDYSEVTYDENDSPNNLADKETMTARHEWYIKSVLEHVAEWEEANGYGTGNHLIYSWDVVNEAVADDAADSDTGYLRGSTSGSSSAALDSDNGCTTGGGSRWYQIYGNEEFIINAFRFANAYAPADVTLCYNDYNEYLNYNDQKGGSYKTNGIKRLLNAILNGNAQTINGKSVKPRIDAMAMQSHVEPSWMTVSSYENALKQFLELGIDVQVTEFDIATTIEDDTGNWSEYFNMFLKYSKKGSEISKYNGHHITGFTIWGLNDENSWISKNGTQFPLLFTKSSDGAYIPKDCFYSVIQAAEEYQQ